MRRWLAVTACAAALSVAAGCGGPPDGIDGDLTNGWGPPPAATQWRPAAGTCFDDWADTAALATYAPIACRERHVAETFFVGDLTGAAAAPGTAARTAAQTSAYAECARRSAGFLGGDWHTARLLMGPVLPSQAAWGSGARWFRCDLGEESSDGDTAGRTGSLKGALTGAAPLRLRCFNPRVTGEDVHAMTPVACDRAHHAEFAGLWTAPDIALSRLGVGSSMGKGCLSIIARFAGVPDDSDVKYRVGWLTLEPNEARWTAGDRAVQCYLWLADETMRGSYRGVGVKKLPIHFA